MKSLSNQLHNQSQRGSLLIFTLWVLILISIFTLSVGYSVRQRLLEIEHLETRERLRLTAEAGVKRVMEVLQRRDAKTLQPDVLNQAWSVNPNEFFQKKIGQGYFSIIKNTDLDENIKKAQENPTIYGAVDEESKIQINNVKKPEILARLFAAAVTDMSRDKATALAEAIVDWVDEDDASFASGAESKYYQWLAVPYVAKNKPVDTLEELLYVKGMSPQILEKIRPYLTVYGNGKVNLNTAPAPVLCALGLSEATVRKIVSYRTGRDQIPGTSDDGVFMDVTTVIPILKGFSFLDSSEELYLQKLIQTGQVDVISKYFTIQSLARLDYNNQVLFVQCVVERYKKIRSWRETYTNSLTSSSPGHKTGVPYEKVA